MTQAGRSIGRSAVAVFHSAMRELLARSPELRVAPGMEPQLRIQWFHRYRDRSVVQRS